MLWRQGAVEGDWILFGAFEIIFWPVAVANLLSLLDVLITYQDDDGPGAGTEPHESGEDSAVGVFTVVEVFPPVGGFGGVNVEGKAEVIVVFTLAVADDEWVLVGNHIITGGYDPQEHTNYRGFLDIQGGKDTQANWSAVLSCGADAKSSVLLLL